MSDIVANISYLRSQIPESVKLVAVSKTKTIKQILEAYNTGQKCFGENRVQEILLKKDLLPSDIEWHLIGHLQSNKVRFIVPFISLIHSVDSFRLLKGINYEASDIKRVIDCLLQIHIASEETKFGFSMKEIVEMISSPEFSSLENVRICGIMGMATFTSDINQIQKEFRYLTGCFNSLKSQYFSSKPFFKEISMGMSGDFKIALNEGSTILRIGSLIFGER
jgi:pyridoxal phosphate enzyme (YggS family)